MPPTLVVDVFAQENGDGALVDSATVTIQPGGLGFNAFFVPAAVFPYDLAAASILDGIFSIGMRETVGHMDVRFLDLYVVTTSGRFVTLTPQVVPEPATLALLGLGIAGLAVVRRRKFH